MKTRNKNKQNRSNLLTRVLIVTGLLFITSHAVLANSKELRVSPFRFAGVHALSSQQGQSDAYMVIHNASGGDWNFNLFDSRLKEIKEGTIEAPRHSFYNNMTYNGQFTLLSFVVNAFTPSITYVVLDTSGNEVSRVTRTDTPMLRRGEQFFPSVYNHPENGFIIVQTTGGGRRAGYTVEHVDHELNTINSIEFTSTRGHIHVYDMAAAEGSLFILEATERFGKTLNARIHRIDLHNNRHIYTMELSDNDYSYFPTALLPSEENSITLAGSYFSGKNIRGKNSRGLFFMQIDEEGGTSGMEIHPWKGLRGTLRTSVPDWFFKVMPDVYIHALEKNADGSISAVAELYRYSGEVRRQEEGKTREQYHRIRMLDFMLINFNPDGSIAFTERIERPHMVLKLDSGTGGGSSTLAEKAGDGPLMRARAMKKGGAFTYRFHQVSDNSFNLAFMSYENKMHYAYLMDIQQGNNAIKVSLQHAKPTIISYMQIIDLCTNQSGFGFILSELNTRSFDDSEAYWRGLLPAGDGSMLIYEYMPLGGRLKLNMVDLPGLKSQVSR